MLSYIDSHSTGLRVKIINLEKKICKMTDGYTPFTRSTIHRTSTIQRCIFARYFCVFGMRLGWRWWGGGGGEEITFRTGQYFKEVYHNMLSSSKGYKQYKRTCRNILNFLYNRSSGRFPTFLGENL